MVAKRMNREKKKQQSITNLKIIEILIHKKIILFYVLKPLHSDHGQQQLDENPFSHLALEIEMDRPSANPFDTGVMPSFDDRAIEEDYRNETAKKFGDGFGRNRMDKTATFTRTTRQSTKELEIPTPPPIVLKEVVPPARLVVKEVKTAATPSAPSVRETKIVTKVPEVFEELDLDDFPPRAPVMPSTDLKPQINIRSRIAIIPKEDVKTRVTTQPVPEPVIMKPKVNAAPPVKAVNHPVVTKPNLHPPPVTTTTRTTKPIVHQAPAKPVIDYFGTNSSNDSKQEVDQKEECFRESEKEANKILFGAAEPSRPLTNSEVSKRKKLILKLVDQKLKQKLTELMNQLGARSKVEQSNSHGEHTDNFADQMDNLMVPDSIPDNPNTEQTQNWTAYPSEANEQTWSNFQQPEMSHDQVSTWPVRPPMFRQPNGWMERPSMMPYPPGIDPMNNMRFAGMRPNWNPNPWQPHMRPPEVQWQQQHNWNMSQPQMNPQLMRPNLLYPPDLQNSTPLPVPPVTQLVVQKPAAEIELELKEKEFLERTLMGTKQRRDADSNRRKTPESKVRSRSQQRRYSRDREKDRRSRDEKKRTSEDRLRYRLKHDSRSSSNRSAERMTFRSAMSPSRLSPSPFPLLQDRSLSGDDFRKLMYNDNQFEAQMAEYVPRSRSRSRDSRSEDLRVRLSQRRNNAHHSRSPTDLRNKLSENRQNRNQPTERPHRKRTRSPRSHSRSHSSKKVTKLDADAYDYSEWMKFNNIVGMLMNIDRDAELTTNEMIERKDIMRLLLENPDLLELDDKFVYKFGKGRLNLAVKEAESILYPNGVPDERIASLISKKIAALPTDKKVTVTKDTVPIEWIKLGNIIDQVLHLTIDERKNLSPNDERMIERDELLLKISDDPNSLLKLGPKYGHRNVEWASKFANKILFRNGIRDKRVDQTIAKERTKALERIGKKKKQSRNSAESHKSSESDSRSSSTEWNQLNALTTKLVQSTLEKFEKMSRDDDRCRDDLLVQMSRDPDAIRSNTKFTDNLDKAVLEDAIKKCKEIIASVKSNPNKSVITEFERQRTKLIDILHQKTQRISAYDQILLRIGGIFGKKHEKCTAEEKKDRENLTEELIKDPESLRTNTKALERIGDDLVVDEIIADIKQILSKLDPSKARGPKKFHISYTKVIDIPFVVKIVDASDQLDDTTKTVLLRALRDMISDIDNPPKPKILQQRYVDRRVEVVCANLLTFEWLKRAIVSDFKDKWPGADLKIERVPVAIEIPRDKLKSVEVAFKDNRATLPFDDIVRELRRENSKLYPERWELQDARGKCGDYKKKTIGIDIESLAALEQMNRFARLGRNLLYFDISYMGDDVPNFEAICQ